MIISFLVKSSISLALLLGCYYLFFRRDKRFLFNRCYLLGSLLFSLILPFVTLPALFQTDYFDDSHLQFATVAQDISAHTAEITVATASHTGITMTYLLYLIYGAGVLGMAFRYVRHLWAIRRLIAAAAPGTNSELSLQLGMTSNVSVRLRLVDQPLDPLSFGRFVLVNKEDYLQGRIHQDVIRHEYLHALHFHTLDILMLELIIVFGWFNPLIWIYRSALLANHEYCADDFVIRGASSVASYSRTLVDFMHHHCRPHLGSGFHYSLTKRRILMMQRTISSASTFAYKLAISLLVVMTLLVTVSFTNLTSSSFASPDDSVFTVVIDAGHGGPDAGVTHEQYQEKDLVLAIAQAMNELSTAPAIRLIYTREGDRQYSLDDRVEMANRSQADLLLSLHINQHDDRAQQGLEVYYSSQNQQSRLSEEYSQQFAHGITLFGATDASIKQADFLVLRKVNVSGTTAQPRLSI